MTMEALDVVETYMLDEATRNLIASRTGGKLPEVLVVGYDGLHYFPDHKPYFYVTVYPRHADIKFALYKVALMLPLARDGRSGRVKTVDENTEVESCYFWNGCKWVERPCRAYRVYGYRPFDIPFLVNYIEDQKDSLLTTAKIIAERPGVGTVGMSDNNVLLQLAAFNIRYPVRLSWDKGLRFFGWKPFYYTDTPPPPDLVKKCVIVDIEVLNNNEIVVGLLPHEIGEQPRPDNAIHLRLPGDEDELVKIFDRYKVVIGFNSKNFDLVYIKQYVPEYKLLRQLHLDLVEIVSTHAQSFQIGVARSLYAVAKVMADKVGVTKKELDLKRRVGGKVRSLSWNELVKYNTNDLVLTAKIANAVVPFVTTIATSIQAPPSVVATLPAGLLAEYYLFRMWEIQGVILGYRRSEPFLKGERVLTIHNWDDATSLVELLGIEGGIDEFDKLLLRLRPKRKPMPQVVVLGFGLKLELPASVHRNVLQVDFKAEYPSFMLYNHVDPLCLKCGELPRGLKAEVPRYTDLLKALECFDKEKEGPVWKAINNLYKLRMMTKKLAKQDEKYKFVDNAVKALLNSGAYGLAAKQGGAAPLADERIGEMIFHGTRAIQYTMFAWINSDPWFRERGIRAVYSDTDSFFLEAPKWTDELKKEILDKLNKFASRFGLVLDEEGVWEVMLVYRKKNYILVGKDGKIVTKGSAVHKDEKFLLPSGVHGLDELLKLSEEEFERWVKEFVSSSQDEDLLYATSSQVSRFVLHDYQAVKRRLRVDPYAYLYIRTPWPNIPTGYLLKITASTLRAPPRLPMVKLMMGSKDWTLELGNYMGFEIKEAFGFPNYGVTGRLLSRYFGAKWSFLMFDGRDYWLVEVPRLYYVLRRGGEKTEIPTDYTREMASEYRGWEIIAVKAKGASARRLEYSFARKVVEETAEAILRLFYSKYVVVLRKYIEEVEVV